MEFPTMSPPLILTLQIDDSAQSFYEDLRQRYFPPERNLIPAHLTLFHKLPDEESSHRALREAVQVTRSFGLTRPQLRSIGRGVAVFFESEQLGTLHVTLSSVFEPHLIPQDRQRLVPHIVIQNKVDPAIARRTLAELQGSLLPEPKGLGLSVWRYLGGPWEHLASLPLAAQTEI